MNFTVPDEFAVVALDLHDNTTQFGILPPGERQEVEDDVCESRDTYILSRIKRLSKKWRVVVLYEAGRMGYWLYRKLKAKGICCIVIDPGGIPQKRRGQSKSDRLDARAIARMARADLLTAVSVPDEETEGIRDLLRCHQGLSKVVTAMKNRITSTLARYNYSCSYTSTPFTLRYRSWLMSEVKLPTQDAQRALEALYTILIQTEVELKEVDQRLVESAMSSRYATACEFLMAIHGIGLLVALSLLTSLQTPHRFSSAREVMAYYGLVPETCTSNGKPLKRPRVTCRGDRLTRWLLIQASWHYARSIRPSKRKTEAQAQLPPWLRERIVKMQKRLEKRFRHLVYAKHKLPAKAVTAVAREMSGWLWAISAEMEEHGLVSFAPAQEYFSMKVA